MCDCGISCSLLLTYLFSLFTSPLCLSLKKVLSKFIERLIHVIRTSLLIQFSSMTFLSMSKEHLYLISMNIFSPCLKNNRLPKVNERFFFFFFKKTHIFLQVQGAFYSCLKNVFI